MALNVRAVYRTPIAVMIIRYMLKIIKINPSRKAGTASHTALEKLVVIPCGYVLGEATLFNIVFHWAKMFESTCRLCATIG